MLVGSLGLFSKPLPLLQHDYETPQSWINIGALRWASINGLVLGFGATSRLGFWLWYAVPLGAFLFGRADLSAAIYGTYGAARGLVVWLFMYGVPKGSWKHHATWLLSQRNSAQHIADVVLVVLGTVGLATVCQSPTRMYPVRKASHTQLLAASIASILSASILFPYLVNGHTVDAPVELIDCYRFAETSKQVCGDFFTYWKQHGGLAQQGYPISEELSEVSDLNGKVYRVQYFERAVFEYHPENEPPYSVLLSLLGSLSYRQRYPAGAPDPQPNDTPGSLFFSQTGRRLGGRFLEYWMQNGGLMQQGYPISDEFTEVSSLDGKPYVVQYFERAVFELHAQNRPPHDVLLSQLGTFQYKRKYQNGDPNYVTPTARPNEWEVLRQRPLHLPSISTDAPCPVTSRNLIEPVPPARLAADYGIGDSPIYPVAYYFDDKTTLHFKSDLANSEGFYSAKVRWVGDPGYEGPALVRGGRIDKPGELRLQGGDQQSSRSQTDMALTAYPGWNDWPASTLVRNAGCYAYQVDGINFTKIIIFAAVIEP